MTTPSLTKAQWRMLRLGERYVHGSGEVRTARSLDKLGLIEPVRKS